MASIIGGGQSVFIKLALQTIPPVTFTFLRFLLACLILLPIFLRNRKGFNFKDGKVLSINLLLVANAVLFAFGIRLTTATVSQVIYSATPIVAAIFSYFILDEKIGVKKALGISLGLAGVLFFIVFPKASVGINYSSSTLGNLIIFIAMICFSFYSVLSKKYLSKISLLHFVFTYSLMMVIFLLPPSILELYSSPNWWQAVPPIAIFSLILVGILGTVVYYFLYQYIILKSTPLIAAMTQYLQPATAYFWASFLLGEKITLELILGTALIFAAVWLTTSKKNP